MTAEEALALCAEALNRARPYLPDPAKDYVSCGQVADEALAAAAAHAKAQATPRRITAAIEVIDMLATALRKADHEICLCDGDCTRFDDFQRAIRMAQEFIANPAPEPVQHAADCNINTRRVNVHGPAAAADVGPHFPCTCHVENDGAANAGGEASGVMKLTAVVESDAKADCEGDAT